MKRCAIYARYSTDLQSPTSIEDQVRLCRAYAERQAWLVVAVFEDRALSGASTQPRQGYQQLLGAALSPTPPFDIVLVEDVGRLTRDTSETLRVYQRLQFRGIEIVGVSDGIQTSQRGAKVHLTIKGLTNELYLDDLREKTHRGLTGAFVRGLSAGGRLFGYRTVPVSVEERPGKHTRPARFEIEAGEAAIVDRIFRNYANGRSMKAIAYTLNLEGVPFPAKGTKRGPARQGWALSTIHTMLRNEKYAGVWTWNKTRFLKDPDTGRRRPVPRPLAEWVVEERPDLRLIEPGLWTAVQERLKLLASRFADGPGRRPKGGAHIAYSLHPLSGLLRCGLCNARMVAHVTTRQKGSTVHRYSSYRCSFATHKGPGVCLHRVGYRQDRLEAALLEKFREAMTPQMIDALAQAVNVQIEAAFQGRHVRSAAVKSEVLQLEREAGNLVRFLAAGNESMMVRDELKTLEATLQVLRMELTESENTGSTRPPRMHRGWLMAKLERIEELARQDPVRARAEIIKHLEGDLLVWPKPSDPGQRRAEVVGRVKADSLLRDQEAVCLQLVAGARFEAVTFWGCGPGAATVTCPFSASRSRWTKALRSTGTPPSGRTKQEHLTTSHIQLMMPSGCLEEERWRNHVWRHESPQCGRSTGTTRARSASSTKACWRAHSPWPRSGYSTSWLTGRPRLRATSARTSASITATSAASCAASRGTG